MRRGNGKGGEEKPKAEKRINAEGVERAVVAERLGGGASGAPLGADAGRLEQERRWGICPVSGWDGAVTCGGSGFGAV